MHVAPASFQALILSMIVFATCKSLLSANNVFFFQSCFHVVFGFDTRDFINRDSWHFIHFHFVCRYLHLCIRPAVMALMESEVAFRKRCEELAEGQIDKCRVLDIVNFSTLAFSVGSTRNRSMKFSWVCLQQIYGGVVPYTANICGLHFEAFNFLMADRKAQVTSSDLSEPVRKLPLWRSKIA